MSTPNKLDERWAAAMPDLAEAAQEAGIDPGIMAKIAGFESGYNSHARPIAGPRRDELNTVTQFDGTMAMSSAYGYGQFLNKACAGMVREHGEKYVVPGAADLTDAQVNTPRTSQQRQASDGPAGRLHPWRYRERQRAAASHQDRPRPLHRLWPVLHHVPSLRTHEAAIQQMAALQ